MRSSSFFKNRRAPLAAVGASLLCSVAAYAQFGGVKAASVLPSSAMKIEAGKGVSIPVKVAIRSGYHINSDTPAEDYLIPTKLTWDTPGFKVDSVEYPEAETVNYSFSEKPLSVFSGTITLRSTLLAPESLPAGLKELNGKLRYQACNDKACLPPVTADVTVPVASN